MIQKIAAKVILYKADKVIEREADKVICYFAAKVIQEIAAKVIRNQCHQRHLSHLKQDNTGLALMMKEEDGES